MRTPYRTVKGNHHGGGVPQEEYDRVVEELNEKTQEYDALLEKYNMFKGGLKLYTTLIPGQKYDMGVYGPISFFEDKYYFFSVVRTEGTGDSSVYGLIGGIKDNSGDIEYIKGQTDSCTGVFQVSSFYKNSDSILCFCRGVFNNNPSNDKRFKVVFNYKTKSITSELVTEETVPEGYEQFTENSWIQQIDTERTNVASFISIVTK